MSGGESGSARLSLINSRVKPTLLLTSVINSLTQRTAGKCSAYANEVNWCRKMTADAVKHEYSCADVSCLVSRTRAKCWALVRVSRISTATRACTHTRTTHRCANKHQCNRPTVTYTITAFWFCSVTFSVYLCPLSFWLTLPREVLSTHWCCPSRPCVVFLTCVHLALFLALSLSPGNSLVSSWCGDNYYASFLALTMSNSFLFISALLRTHSFVFFAVYETRRIFLSPFISKASIRVSSFFRNVELS